MERIRLTGLFLFITAIFLGLAAAATKTTHIDFKTPDRLVGADSSEDTASGTETSDGASSGTAGSVGADQGMPNSGNTGLDATDQGGAAQEKAAVQFTSVPIIYPLAGVGMLGLALWFVPATELPRKQTTTRKRRKRRSTSRSRRLFGR